MTCKILSNTRNVWPRTELLICIYHSRIHLESTLYNSRSVFVTTLISSVSLIAHDLIKLYVMSFSYPVCNLFRYIVVLSAILCQVSNNILRYSLTFSYISTSQLLASASISLWMIIYCKYVRQSSICVILYKNDCCIHGSESASINENINFLRVNL